jgi:hypothetical protein
MRLFYGTLIMKVVFVCSKNVLANLSRRGWPDVENVLANSEIVKVKCQKICCPFV